MLRLRLPSRASFLIDPVLCLLSLELVDDLVTLDDLLLQGLCLLDGLVLFRLENHQLIVKPVNLIGEVFDLRFELVLEAFIVVKLRLQCCEFSFDVVAFRCQLVELELLLVEVLKCLVIEAVLI